LFSKEASEEARLDEKGWKDKKRKDEAARPINTNYKHPSSKDIMINIIFIYYNI